VYIGEDAMENKSEGDSNDTTECPHDDQPSSGMFFTLYTLLKYNSLYTLWIYLFFVLHLLCIHELAICSMSVCLSHAGVESKLITIGSCRYNHLITWEVGNLLF